MRMKNDKKNVISYQTSIFNENPQFIMRLNENKCIKIRFLLPLTIFREFFKFECLGTAKF